MARKKQGRQGRARRGRSTARGGAKRSAAKSARRTRTLGPAAQVLADDHRRVEALFGSYIASADEERSRSWSRKSARC